MRGPQHEFCAKMKFPAQKNKNTSVNGTTSLAVIVGPKCLIAHLLAPHDRAFSHDSEHLAPTPSSTEFGVTTSPPAGGSRAETREATGLETEWRGSLLLFCLCLIKLDLRHRIKP